MNFFKNLTFFTNSLVTMYESFISLRIEYVDMIFDQPYTSMSAQYDMVLTKTGTVTGSSKGQPYHDLSLETLQQKRMV